MNALPTTLAAVLVLSSACIDFKERATPATPADAGADGTRPDATRMDGAAGPDAARDGRADGGGPDAGDAAGPDASDAGDSGCASPRTWYRDTDGDGHGAAVDGVEKVCVQPKGYVELDDDEEPDCATSHEAVCDVGDERCAPGGDSSERESCVREAGCTQWKPSASCDAAAPLCAGGACVECTAPEHCEPHGANAAVCEAGSCVQCVTGAAAGTAGATACGARACSALAPVCSAHDAASREQCETCDTDTNCIADHYCVRMTYADEERPEGYCLKEAPGCADPYVVEISNRASVSDLNERNYCGIDETISTCEAALALVADLDCVTDAECPTGALCRALGISIDKSCSYECESPGHCPDVSGQDTCDNGGDDESVDFCGG